MTSNGVPRDLRCKERIGERNRIARLRGTYATTTVVAKTCGDARGELWGLRDAPIWSTREVHGCRHHPPGNFAQRARSLHSWQLDCFARDPCRAQSNNSDKPAAQSQPAPKDDKPNAKDDKSATPHTTG